MLTCIERFLKFVLGTLLKGQPIILLPPKTIILKKVDFNAEERGFYQSLEAESRAQFAVCFYMNLEQLRKHTKTLLFPFDLNLFL